MTRIEAIKERLARAKLFPGTVRPRWMWQDDDLAYLLKVAKAARKASFEILGDCHAEDCPETLALVALLDEEDLRE